jgi:KUP system potassium uptake protein
MRRHVFATIGVVGAVYGDLGTSPLYALKACFALGGVTPTPANVLGVISLVFWTLVIVVGVKYLAFVVREDNQGEGGIVAIASLLLRRHQGRVGIALLLALAGTGLVIASGVITPGISVLGAIEGLAEHDPRLHGLIVPVAVALLVGLFLAQRRGVGRLERAVGPILVLWFVAIGAIGTRWIIAEPAVLEALHPEHALAFLASHGARGFAMLGLVALVVTGAETLYSSIGDHGVRPIRAAWCFVAMPALLLGYLGQGAVLLAHEPGTIANPFYAMVEGPLRLPMTVLATLAALVASHAMISRVFAIARQAMQLGFWPRVTVLHRSAQGVFIPELNGPFMLMCIAAVVGFGSSVHLAAAYAVASTGTMLVTTLLLHGVVRARRNNSSTAAFALTAPFLALDLALFASAISLIADGGWLPLVIAAGVYTVMRTWQLGRTSLMRILDAAGIPEPLFLDDLASNPPLRVAGTAVFMSATRSDIPNVLLHHLKHNQALHRQVVLLTVEIDNVPIVDLDRGLEVHELRCGFFRVIARFGFMQDVDVPRVLARTGLAADPLATSYYLGRDTVLPGRGTPLARWRKGLFAFLSRNAKPPTDFFHLPPNRVIEVGAQVVM